MNVRSLLAPPRQFLVAGLLAAVLAATVGGCGDSSATAPTPPPVIPTNTAPVIQSIVAGAPQVEVTGDQSIQLTATVTDAETSPAQLTYNWSASPADGTFIGTGAQVRWKAPSTTPDAYSITLTVVESYVSQGVTKENRVPASVQVRYNDMILGGLVGQFLGDFGNFSMTPDQCVRNFSNSCAGKSQELSDVQKNRKQVHITSAVFSVSSVVVNGSRADIVAPCTFKDNLGTTSGDCLLTAVYESSKWLLCDSSYRGSPTTSGFEGTPSAQRLEIDRYRHP